MCLALVCHVRTQDEKGTTSSCVVRVFFLRGAVDLAGWDCGASPWGMDVGT